MSSLTERAETAIVSTNERDRPASLRRRDHEPWAARLRPLAGYLLLSPALATLVVFYYIPAALLFYIAFFHWNLYGGSSPFVGLGNFQTLVNQPLFWQSLLDTAYYVAVMVPATLLLSLALALLLREGARQLRGGLTQALIFLPHVTPIVATSIIWIWVFNPHFGLANYLLHLVGLPQLGWLESTRWALPAVMIYSLWHSVGLYMVLFLAGLATIPERVVEAARIDGAKGFALLRRVIWPLLAPTTFVVLVLVTVSALQAFSQIYTMTGGPHGGAGGPAFSTTTDAVLIYQTAFIYQHFSLAAAMSLILFLLLLGITAVQKWLASKWVFYQ